MEVLVNYYLLLYRNYLINNLKIILGNCQGVIQYLGDGYCDDANNVADCSYDYGDCCLTEKNPVTGNNVDNYCESCLCKSNETGYPSTFGTPPPGPPAAGPPGQPQGQPPMYVYY